MPSAGPEWQATRTSILARHAQRFARLDGGTGTVEVFAVHQRVTADNPAFCHGERRLLMRFTFSDGKATLEASTEMAGETSCVA